MDNGITFFRTIKQQVTFYKDDFKTEDEYNKFIERVKNDENFMMETFYDNLDEENYDVIEGVTIDVY